MGDRHLLKLSGQHINQERLASTSLAVQIDELLLNRMARTDLGIVRDKEIVHSTLLVLQLIWIVLLSDRSLHS